MPGTKTPRRHFALALGSAVLGAAALAGCGHREQALSSPEAFGQYAETLLRWHHPRAGCKAEAGGGALVCGEVSLGLDNLYRDLRESQARRSEIDRRLLGEYEEARRRAAAEQGLAAGETPSWEEARTRLRPQLVPSDFGANNPDLLRRAFLPGVDLAYAIDEVERYALVLTPQAASWGVGEDDLYAVALANLAAACEPGKLAVTLPSEPGGEGRWVALDSDDGYAAARVLVPAMRQRLAALLGEPFYVALPNRDFLVAWSRDSSFHAAFAERARQDFAHKHHPLSPEVFVAAAEEIRPATAADLPLGPPA